MGIFTKKTWKNTVAQNPSRRKLTNVSTGDVAIFDVEREVGTVTQQGDVWNAQNMNELENRIDSAITQVSNSMFDLVKVETYTGTATISANSTTLIKTLTIPSGYAIMSVTVEVSGSSSAQSIDNLLSGGRVYLYNSTNASVTWGYTIYATYIKNNA